MHLSIKLKNTLIVILVVIFAILNVNAQLGFCGGNSGDPIFTENFGTAPSAAVQYVMLPSGTTGYNYRAGLIGDGSYHVTNTTNDWGTYDWFQIGDHTPNDTNGRMLVVNASFAQGEFFRIPITGLCENTTYEFSSWMVNLTPSNSPLIATRGNPEPNKVRFEILNAAGLPLPTPVSGSTGDILPSLNPTWVQYGLVFQTPPGQTSVILRMINEGAGGYGNDLAIDDIVFKSCGDNIDVEDSANNNNINICSTQTPYATALSAIPDNTVFSTHFYQWQESTNGTTWTDIAGATNANISISGISNTMHYRAKVAESATNLNNALCNTLSDVFQINVNPAPTFPTGLQCWETATFNNATCSWDISGTQPAMPTSLQCWETTTFNNSTCVWDVTGSQALPPTTQCWETATFNTTTCTWDVTGTQPVPPTVACYETTTFNTSTCQWDISGTQPLQPTTQCWETATFNTTTCIWDVTGSQPAAPTVACYETTTFNATTCQWDISGTQPIQPTTQCWETTTFNTTTCSWDVTGAQPVVPTVACYETTTFNATTCQWDISGTQSLQPTTQCWETASFNNTTCIWEVTGTQPSTPTGLQCWQTAVFNNVTCLWDITGTQPVDNLDVSICTNETITLEPTTTATNPTYLWNTGEITESIIVSAAGNYDVEITDNGCLFVKRTYNVTQIESPIINTIKSEGNDIIIKTTNSGDFLYSIDGNVFQSNNTFYNVKGGLYTISVKAQNCNEADSTQFLHFYIPKYFTPNNDGNHDTFDLSGIEYFGASEVSIFNRYGKLLKHAVNTTFSWEGIFNGEGLPSDDYWYVIIIDGKRFSGHITLKR